MPTARFTRRDLLKTGASAALVASLPRPLLVQLGGAPEPIPLIDDPRLKALAMRAVEAAKSAGAAYADVRLTHTRIRTVSTPKLPVGERESMTVGVRALVKGYWGFAASSVWSADELARLGRESVHQAGANSLGKARVVELAPVPVVADGHWVMPVKRDPFDVPIDEIHDFFGGLRYYNKLHALGRVSGNAGFTVQEKAFASTEGSYCTQRLYTTGGGILVSKPDNPPGLKVRPLDSITPSGLGWELFTGQPNLDEQIEALYEELVILGSVPQKPAEVGRYDTVFDASGMAGVLNQTLGDGTQLDRALGYEANAGGTSYFNQPFEMLGRYQAGAPLLTVTANRSEPGAVGTVQWDDEGVAPRPFTLVKDGVLQDFQTMRESAGWMKDYYAKHNLPFQSHGCANADEGVSAPLVHTPNLVMVPGKEALDFNSLIQGLSTGLAIRGFGATMDFQGLNGMGGGDMFEVKQGKRVALMGGSVLFRAPEFWKGLLAIGGAQSAQRVGLLASKGEPLQQTYHSVSVVPALVKQLTVIDPSRKA